MEEQKRKDLKEAYRKACDAYLEAFAEKHGFCYEDCDWVGRDPGGCASVGDYFVDMQTIIADIELNAPEDEWIRWYDYSLECSELELPCSCNFESWLRGCPRYSQRTFDRIRSLRKNVENAKAFLEKAVEEEKQNLFF